MTRLAAPHVANYFLDKADAEGKTLTMLKLMKMVYIAQGWSLALLDRDIINESIEAWQYGPVIPSLYHEFKHFGGSPITSRATFFDLLLSAEDDYEIELSDASVPEDDKSLVDLLDKVWKAYKKYSGADLVDLTHQQNTPWEKCYKDGQRNIIIETDVIKNYYNSKK